MYFIQGFIMGLAYVAPIGLQNLFVINAAVSQRKSIVYLTALIVIFFDVTLAFACFFGIGAIMNASPWLSQVVLFIGSIIVLWIGVGLLGAKGEMGTSPAIPGNSPILKTMTTACVVTWFNPQALIDGSMMLGAFKATLPAEQDLYFILGVAMASCVWFLSLSTIISLFTTRITGAVLQKINFVCGVIIIIYGLKLGWDFVLNLR